MPSLLAPIKNYLWRLSLKGMACGPHITRYAMYERLREVGDTLPRRTGKVLSISRSLRLGVHLGLEPVSVVEADYPEYNVLSLPFENGSFDFVLLDQVLEHVEGSPRQVFDECRRVLQDGGIMVLTTCFIYPRHGAPADYWRFSPDGLRLLGSNFRRIIECDGWGNFDAWLLIRDGLLWEKIPHASWHPLHRLAVRNDPEWPIVAWVVAQK